MSSLTQMKPVELVISTRIEISLAMTAKMIPESLVCCFVELLYVCAGVSFT